MKKKPRLKCVNKLKWKTEGLIVQKHIKLKDILVRTYFWRLTSRKIISFSLFLSHAVFQSSGCFFFIVPSHLLKILTINFNEHSKKLYAFWPSYRYKMIMAHINRNEGQNTNSTGAASAHKNKWCGCNELHSFLFRFLFFRFDNVCYFRCNCFVTPWLWRLPPYVYCVHYTDVRFWAPPKRFMNTQANIRNISFLRIIYIGLFIFRLMKQISIAQFSWFLRMHTHILIFL